MKRFINKFVLFSILIYLCPNGSYASPNFCIIGDNTTDCSLNHLDITSLSTGIINTGNILGDVNGEWAGIYHDGLAPNADPINGITNFGTITGVVNGIGIWGSAVISGGITNKNGAGCKTW